LPLATERPSYQKVSGQIEVNCVPAVNEIPISREVIQKAVLAMVDMRGTQNSTCPTNLGKQPMLIIELGEAAFGTPIEG
jgi:hypothetical protein